MGVKENQMKGMVDQMQGPDVQMMSRGNGPMGLGGGGGKRSQIFNQQMGSGLTGMMGGKGANIISGNSGSMASMMGGKVGMATQMSGMATQNGNGKPKDMIDRMHVRLANMNARSDQHIANTVKKQPSGWYS